MPRGISPNRIKAYDLWKASGGTRPLIDIAKELSVSPEQVRKWKSQDKWDTDKVTLLKDKSNVTNGTKAEKSLDKSLIRSVEQNETLTEKQKLFCLCYVKNFNATQAAINAGYSPGTAYQYGYQLLQKSSIQAEIKRLKEMKAAALMINETDIVERYMKIAFADMTDFAEFGTEEVPVMSMYGPIKIKNPETGENETLTKIVNTVKFKESTIVDGGLICQIKQGKDGASIKLEDRQKALDWLSKYFLMNPIDKHKIEYDKRRIAIEEKKAEKQLSDQNLEANVVINFDIDKNTDTD